jgi:magnesium transporter
VPEPEHPLAETAERHLVRGVPTARGSERAGEVFEALRGRSFDALDTVYVVDAEGRLEGLVPLRDLVAAPPEAELCALMLTEPPTSAPDADQEHVASIAHEQGLASVAVVDADGRLLGAVPPEALVEVLRREHVEDLHRLAGILHGAEQARGAMLESPVRRLRHRLPWLVVGLLGSVLATVVVAGFERSLEERVAVAFFIPAIVYLADAIGTQTEAVAVRGLSLGPSPLRRLLLGEAAAGILIGVVLGGLAFAGVVGYFHDVPLGLSVGIAIVVAGAIASSVGLLFPWALERAGADPAYGSGPVATIIQDVLSLLTYFVTVRILL